MFTPEIYRRRRSRLLDRDLRGILFFPGNEAVPMNYRDNHYPFRQDSSFLYFWGLNRPDLVACLDSENGSA
ncbi:MAG: aminopeptidase P N-terminal domain-containing protein, partial [Fidelibacterota bacterium]